MIVADGELVQVVPRDMGYAYSHATTGLFWMDLQQDDMHWTLTDTGWAKAAWGKHAEPATSLNNNNMQGCSFRSFYLE